jgi:hypothetical protein
MTIYDYVNNLNSNFPHRTLTPGKICSGAKFCSCLASPTGTKFGRKQVEKPHFVERM